MLLSPVSQLNPSEASPLDAAGAVEHGQNHLPATTSQHATIEDVQAKHDCISAKCVTQIKHKNWPRHLWSQWLKFVCPYCHPANAFENPRLDHIQSHHKAKHPGKPGPKRPKARDVAAGTVLITDTWSALACGVCAQCFEATPGDAASMLKAQTEFVIHVNRQHQNPIPQAWQVGIAVEGLLKRTDVAPMWERLLAHYGCDTMDNVIGDIQDDYAEWWCKMLRYPTSPEWLERNLPPLLVAGIFDREPQLAMAIHVPDFSANSSQAPVTQPDATSGAALTYQNLDLLGAAAGPSTRTTTATPSFYTAGIDQMDIDTAPTTADLDDARPREEAALEHSKSQASIAMENDAYPFTEPPNGQVFSNVGGGPALEDFSSSNPGTGYA